MVITGSAAGMRLGAVPPPPGGRRLVVWRLPGEPGTPEATEGVAGWPA